MATTLAWHDVVDGIDYVLANGLPAPADRFAVWLPDVEEIGDVDQELGSGVTHLSLLREDFVVHLELHQLDAVAQILALRLKRHLWRGGSVTVNTGDQAARSYTCRLKPKTIPEVAEDTTDPEFIRFLFRAQLLNTAAAFLLCVY
jgi:hypothetical protein